MGIEIERKFLLTNAENELSEEKETFELPEWAGEEVSEDPILKRLTGHSTLLQLGY